MNLGKILSDEKKVSDYGITEKDFVVVMVTKVEILSYKIGQAS